MLKLVTPPVVPLSVPVPIADAGVPGRRQRRPIAEPVRADDPRARRGGRGAGRAAADPGEIATMPAAGRAAPDDVRSRLRLRRPPVDWSWEQLVLAVVLAGCHGLVGAGDGADRPVPPRCCGTSSRCRRSGKPGSASWPGGWACGDAPSVCLVPGGVPPMLWAIGRPARLLVPAELWATMGDDERTSLLLHELAHLKRRDHWVRWLELIVAGLYWWHPAVWWLRRVLREAEEQCCDAWVVWAMPRGARTYATALLAALEFVSGARTAPAAAARPPAETGMFPA